MAVARSDSPPPDDFELRECLERMLSETDIPASGIASIDRAPSEHWSSYETEILTVRLTGGNRLQMFLKDFGRSRLSKDAGERRERELRVYEYLLQGEEPGTARFYGARWDEPAARFWFVLECVDGKRLRDCSFEHWLEAAAWRGRLRARFVSQLGRLRECGFLMRHDADFFLHTAERALRAVSGLSEALAQRLAGVLQDYDAIVDVLTRDSDTLVHGSYRPQNLLVVPSSKLPRICPTDWELAALGRSTYDLAFICDGFRPPRLEALFEAYEREAESSSLPVRESEELRHEVDCFRLHKKIKSLGHAHRWKHPAKTAEHVVAAAEEIAGTLA